ncbi:MAG: hypothetical protein K9J37_02335 [Saprospiraceae bacterium]|nr:hypothetical protein [Saprospiraceae bacterium]MCF8248718.1 hypothetical protein [Saprospiraceae bacterium]MCF8278792.1 hypothetical protein [Bacteroidales bacterium]MCF8310592.1 hypothetical protein [Saprospiraceae bacterium]MCF8439151.1 hypothetical protein [Saprospiraceae bacterium]
MSDLEKYILENRDELDRMEPVPEEAMWQKIRANSTRQKPAARAGFNWKLLTIAAFLVALVGWGLLFFGGRNSFRQMPTTPIAAPTAPVAEQKTKPIAEDKTTTPTQEQVLTIEKKSTPPIAERPKQKARKPAKTEVETPPVVSEEERQLQQLVAQKQQEIGLDTLNRAAYADLLSELDELEISVEEARSDLGGMPQRERLMETLIRYYELKIRILEQINYEINKQKYHAELEKRI